MRNRVEIRAYAIEQVVKMRCMSNCKAETLIEQAKMLEEYIVGDATVREYGTDTQDWMQAMGAMSVGTLGMESEA